MVTPVLRPARLVGLRAGRDLLAVGNRLQAVAGHAQGDEVVESRPRPALAEGEVVLDGAALVAVALDRHPEEVELLERLRVLGEHRAVRFPDVRAVVVEADVLEEAHAVDLVRGHLLEAVVFVGLGGDVVGRRGRRGWRRRGDGRRCGGRQRRRRARSPAAARERERRDEHHGNEELLHSTTPQGFFSSSLLTDFLKLRMPSPRPRPSSGMRLVPKMRITMTRMRMISGKPRPNMAPPLRRPGRAARPSDDTATPESRSFLPLVLLEGGHVELERRQADDLQVDAALRAADDLSLVDVVLVDLDVGLAFGAHRHPRILFHSPPAFSKTIRPPTMVITTRVFRMSAGATAVGSRSSTVKSARLLTAMVPRSPSSKAP